MAIHLFASQTYTCTGGWDQFIGEYPTVLAAKRAINLTRKTRTTPARTDTVVVPETVNVGQRYNDGTVTAVDDETITIDYPRRTYVEWDYKAARIVSEGQIVAVWSDGRWT